MSAVGPCLYLHGQGTDQLPCFVEPLPLVKQPWPGRKEGSFSEPHLRGQQDCKQCTRTGVRGVRSCAWGLCPGKPFV